MVLDRAITGPDVDWFTRIRRIVCPPLHRLSRPLGGYAECIMDPDEYVGSVDRELSVFVTELRAMGFRREPISSLKRHEDGRFSVGSWVKRPSPLADKQLHVTLFRNRTASIDIFAHHEDSWISHPIRHYRATGWDTTTGVAKMRRLLTHHGIGLIEA